MQAFRIQGRKVTIYCADIAAKSRQDAETFLAAMATAISQHAPACEQDGEAVTATCYGATHAARLLAKLEALAAIHCR